MSLSRLSESKKSVMMVALVALDHLVLITDKHVDVALVALDHLVLITDKHVDVTL